MQDITKIDWNKPYAKRVAHNPAKQKVFFIQDGIEYGADGKACNTAQVKKYYANQAVEAQKLADEAKEAAANAQKNATAMLKDAGLSKAEVQKAAG